MWLVDTKRSSTAAQIFFLQNDGFIRQISSPADAKPPVIEFWRYVNNNSNYISASRFSYDGRDYWTNKSQKWIQISEDLPLAPSSWHSPPYAPPSPDCIIIKGLACALWLENNFKIIRHIFPLKATTTTKERAQRESQLSFIINSLMAWKSPTIRREGACSGCRVLFCKDLIFIKNFDNLLS